MARRAELACQIGLHHRAAVQTSEMDGQRRPSRDGHPMGRVSAVLGQAVQFVYTCWNRIVLNGDPQRLQRPEYLAHFFHNVAGGIPASSRCARAA